ncbi:MAG TPA: carbohydrate porin [Chthoniobacteraceae bacterium]|jgi:porin|nr:carbohydrate porin [Chthoniobacteraceae bacterium]
MKTQPIPLRLLACGLLLSTAGLSFATPPPTPVPEIDNNQTSQPSEANQPAPSQGNVFSGLQRSAYLLGDMGGLRPFLSRFGLSLSITETSEVLGNVTGGTRRGADYDGLTQAVLQLDTERAFDLHGGTFNVSALQIHGRNLSADNLDSLQTASGIEADRATRLWELWYQQKFLNDRFDIKIGQQSLDQEFMVSDNALLFVNTMFGWPMVPSADLPAGGPAYPLSALGIRGRVKPTDSLTLLAGVFNGTPVSGDYDDPQQANASGASFPLHGGTLAIAELQFVYPANGAMVYQGGGQPLSGVYKLGFWYDSEDFDDQEYDGNGLSLANPASSGNPREHHGDYSIYAVIDQTIWNDPDDPDADRDINFFTRVMGTPQSDRNLIDFSANAGFTFHEPIPGRSDDTLGLGMGYAHVSNRASDLDKDTGDYSQSGYPVRSGETFVELTYQYQLTPWCQLQPDFQYIFNPGGGIPNPNSPTGSRIKNEAILGMRINVLF